MIGRLKMGSFCGSALLLAACIGGGGGTDTETGGSVISGRIVSSDGNPAPGVRTLLLPSQFNPVAQCPIADSLIDTTDAEGRYSFAVDSGTFNIEGFQSLTGTRLFLSGIIANRRDVRVSTDTLKLPGKIRVNLDSVIASQGGFLYLLGSTVKKKFYKGEDSIVIDSVPLATYPEMHFAEDGSCGSIVLYKNILVDTPESVFDPPDTVP